MSGRFRDEHSSGFEHLVRIAEPLTELAHQLQNKRTNFPVDSDEAAGSMLVGGGRAEAGAGFNVVSASAWLSIDRRFDPEEQLDAEFDRLTNLITATARSIGAQVEVACFRSSPPTAPTSGIPAFAYGGGRLEVSHGLDEYIDEAHAPLRRGLCTVLPMTTPCEVRADPQRRSRTPSTPIPCRVVRLRSRAHAPGPGPASPRPAVKLIIAASPGPGMPDVGRRDGIAA